MSRPSRSHAISSVTVWFQFRLIWVTKITRTMRGIGRLYFVGPAGNRKRARAPRQQAWSREAARGIAECRRGDFVREKRTRGPRGVTN